MPAVAHFDLTTSVQRTTPFGLVLVDQRISSSYKLRVRLTCVAMALPLQTLLMNSHDP